MSNRIPVSPALWALGLSVIALAAACCPPMAPDAAPPTLAVGTAAPGRDEYHSLVFKSLAEVDGVPVESGPQGGNHIFMAVRGSGYTDEVTLTYGIRDVETQVDLTQTLRSQQILTDGDGHVVLYGFLKPADYSTWPGKRVVFWAKATIQDCLEAHAEEQTVIIPKPPPQDGP